MLNLLPSEELIKMYARVAWQSHDGEVNDYLRHKVYLSGPITGVKNYKGLFMFAESLVALCNAIQIYNPATQIPPICRTWEHAMKRCLLEIAKYDTVVMLPGWNVSRGARLEHDVALACGMDIVDFSEDKIVYGLYNALKGALEKRL